MRVKFLKDHKEHHKGSTLEVSPNEGFGLIDSGVAIVSKDIVEQDYKTKALDEEQANGNTTQLRINNKS